MAGKAGILCPYLRMNSGTQVAQDSPESAFRFDAFLSYSRKDIDFAKCLEKELRSYLPPRDLPVPRRRLRVFRDQADISGVELTQALDSNLGNSAWSRNTRKR